MCGDRGAQQAPRSFFGALDAGRLLRDLSPGLSGGAGRLAKPGKECFNQIIETGVLHEVGLRDTLEPDPDNTGVGSFLSPAAFFLELQREFSCFMQMETRGFYAHFCCR
jgi:hypothetical protein